ncbi:unnamed protein product [Somion occarium]|uniref:Protein kinase domain-containing protein n=1 Tax=Somion occarium TaxID=3059160 RepID=A0ABP1DEA1_9APHY
MQTPRWGWTLYSSLQFASIAFPRCLLDSERSSCKLTCKCSELVAPHSRLCLSVFVNKDTQPPPLSSEVALCLLFASKARNVPQQSSTTSISPFTQMVHGEAELSELERQLEYARRTSRYPPTSFGEMEGFYHLEPAEHFWRNVQPFLTEQGYLLKPRYHIDWVPSWYETKKKPHKCKDGHVLIRPQIIDAVRTSDGTEVALKKLQSSTGWRELEIARLFSSEPRRSDLRNHCIPILDIIELPGEDISILVMPKLMHVNRPKWRTVGEILEFCEQTIEGLQFMHEHLVAHRNPTCKNILSDSKAKPINSKSLFSLAQSLRYGLRSVLFSSIANTPRYYFIDFGLSRRYERDGVPYLDPPVGGDDETLPEWRWGDPEMESDPFAADIYHLGNIFRVEFLEQYTNIKFLEHLIWDMIHPSPAHRPTMDEVARTFKDIMLELPENVKRSRSVKKDEHPVAQVLRDTHHLACTSTRIWRHRGDPSSCSPMVVPTRVERLSIVSSPDTGIRSGIVQDAQMTRSEENTIQPFSLQRSASNRSHPLIAREKPLPQIPCDNPLQDQVISPTLSSMNAPACLQEYTSSSWSSTRLKYSRPMNRKHTRQFTKHVTNYSDAEKHMRTIEEGAVPTQTSIDAPHNTTRGTMCRTSEPQYRKARPNRRAFPVEERSRSRNSYNMNRSNSTSAVPTRDILSREADPRHLSPAEPNSFKGTPVLKRSSYHVTPSNHDISMRKDDSLKQHNHGLSATCLTASPYCVPSIRPYPIPTSSVVGNGYDQHQNMGKGIQSTIGTYLYGHTRRSFPRTNVPTSTPSCDGGIGRKPTS